MFGHFPIISLYNYSFKTRFTYNVGVGVTYKRKYMYVHEVLVNCLVTICVIRVFCDCLSVIKQNNCIDFICTVEDIIVVNMS